ncbi:MAG TPA: leucyl aminopeptidase [Chloroflexota bacterium]
MEVEVLERSLTEVATPLLVVNLFEGVQEPGGATGAVDQALGGLVRRLIAAGEIAGRLGEVTVVHVPPGTAGLAAERVAVVGLGSRERFDAEAVRVAAAVAARKAQELRLPAFATVLHGAGAGGLDPSESARAIVEASILATNREFSRYWTDPGRRSTPVERLLLVERDATRAAVVRAAARLGRIAASGALTARDLSWGPPNVFTPAYLAARAEEVAARYGLEARVYGLDEIGRMRMGGILAVNAGSAHPPRLVLLRHRGRPGARKLGVVGKGITFDTGGISLKPEEGLHYMRHDKSGAAAVVGFLQAAAEADLPVEVVGVFAATENMPDGAAFRPGDVLTMYNGKTVEVISTDAEGRLILADALAFTREQGVDALVDLATLTGAVVRALGNHAIGLMGNDEALIDLVRRAGDLAGERAWPLPLWDVYEHQIESRVADIRNTGAGAARAGAITAARFLRHFVGDTPWVHLDIAGTAYTDDQQKYVPPYHPTVGATGVGVRLLMRFCELWTAS